MRSVQTQQPGVLGPRLVLAGRQPLEELDQAIRITGRLVESVIGQIKHGRAFRQLLLRSLEQARDEWNLICTADNLLKLTTAPA